MDPYRRRGDSGGAAARLQTCRYSRHSLSDGGFRLSFQARPADIHHRVPNPGQRERINQIIYEELVRAIFLPSSLTYFQDVIRDLRDDGCDALALACTEIPLLVSQADSELPILDSTRILARAALRAALS
jgi:aspartate/glutamate racemase